MNDSEKIQVLLKEYETLRAEMLQRFGNRFQFLTIIGALAAFLVFKADMLSVLQVCAIGFALVFTIAIWFWLGELAARCSKRVSEIEKEVNRLAGQELLLWESMQIQTGLFHKVQGRMNPYQQNLRGDSENRAKDGTASGAPQGRR